MKIIAQVRLYPDDQQRTMLRQTLETANTACNSISQQGWQAQTFRRYDLQNLTYYDVRERFGLTAQMVIRCLAKVADAYRLDQDKPRTFNLAGRQRRFQRAVNHHISKRLVLEAERTQWAIALENLKGIRQRTRVRGKEKRARHSNWAFAQLRQFIEYKARLAGIPVIYVDPGYTSQQCFECGHTERANRKTQDQFLCCACGHTAHADVNAAKNIAWAAVNPPIVSDAASDAAPETSFPL